MEPSTRGYSPEQIANGTMDDGRDVVILYVKEFCEQLKRVSAGGEIGYFYTWSHVEDTNSFVLFIYWNNDEEVAIVFPPKQHYIINSFHEPKQLVITALPIKTLVEAARQTGQNFIDFQGPVVCLDNVVYKEPKKPVRQ